MEKIIVFTPSLKIGGIERILLTYAKGLSEKGYDVTYLTLSNNGDFDPSGFNKLVYKNLGIKRLRQALFALIKFFKNTKPDIIFAANEATLIVYLAKILSRSKAKLITSQHNYYDNFDKLGLKQTFVPKRIFPLCYKVIAVSEGIRSMLINTFKVNSQKVVTICNPIDIAEIQRQSELSILNLPKDYFLFVGRFDKVKNLPLLLEAFSMFNKKFPDVKLFMIGDGPELNTITSNISSYKLENSVNILGVKSNPFPYIKNAKVVSLSSLTEAFPTVLLEALSLGKTIVSTPTFGGNDILEKGKYGYLSESLFSAEDFYKKLIEAYNKPFDPNELKTYVQINYSLNQKVVEFENLWKS